MSVRFGILLSLALLLIFPTDLPGLCAQQKAPPRYQRDFLIASAREIMTSARYCALITIDAAGRVNARAMDPFPPEADMTVWFGTNSKSRKVREIRRRPSVTLYYFNRENQEYVVISGIARIVSDRGEKAKRWKDEWKAFYPDRDNDYLLIKVTPISLEIISEKKAIFGDPKTWKPPVVVLRSRSRQG